MGNCLYDDTLRVVVRVKSARKKEKNGCCCTDDPRILGTARLPDLAADPQLYPIREPSIEYLILFLSNLRDRTLLPHGENLHVNYYLDEVVMPAVISSCSVLFKTQLICTMLI